VRRVLNRGFAAAGLPIEAVVPTVDLWVRRSVTDADGVPASPNGRHLADIAAEPNATAPGPLRDGLFDLVRVHALDRLKRAANNFLYLRSANLGTAPQVDARHRLFRLNLAATPIAATAVGATVAETVPAGGTAIVQFEFNPGNVDVGSREFVLGVCDHEPDRALTVPASFPDVAALDDFCARNPNAAYREFVVGP
jgi:hypothetical protein